MVEMFDGATLQIFERLSDLMDQPNFRKDIISKSSDTTNLKIVGTYDEPIEVACSLKDCHHAHKRGFVVSLGDRLITNVGNRCGKNAFGVKWENATGDYTTQREDFRRRNMVRAFRAKLPEVESELAQLKDGSRGARWAHPLIYTLRTRYKGLPVVVVDRVSELVRLGSGVLTVAREKTEAEREAEKFGGAGADGGKKTNFVDERVGLLRGIRACSEEMSLSKLLGADLTPNIDALKAVDPDTASYEEVDRLAKLASGIDEAIGRLREALRACAELLTKPNIMQLQLICTDDTERQQVKDFADKLPA